MARPRLHRPVSVFPAAALNSAPGNLTVTPPSGYEVSLSSGSGYTTSLSVPYGSATLASTTVYVRLATNTAVGNYSGNIQVSGGGASPVNVATIASSVGQAPLTITGLTGANKVYDGTTNASFTGTAAYSGLVNNETFTVSGIPNASFATAGAGNGKTINVTGYTAPSGNYSLTQPTLTGNITPATPSITLISSLNPAGYHDSLIFTATNLPVDVSSNVVFTANGVAFSTNGLSNGGTASLVITNLPRATTNLIAATYVGDNNYVSASASLTQTVTNHPPVANPTTYSRNAAVNQIKIAVTNLLGNATDVDGDNLTLASVSATTNAAILIVSGDFVMYSNTNAVNDEFTYTVSDGFGGTNSATVTLTVDSTPLFGQVTLPAVNTAGGTATLNFAGIPNYSYSVMRATNLTSSWTAIWTTNAPASGVFQFIDLAAPQPSAYYQLRYNP